ncbi:MULTISPECIES: WXG100 family type VII secretion target [unclassified Mycobacterium]|uniref:WXG100 family type VII secretion target n=1 Tax=unclassified Mycobacterium TaxID=2642494 RepID=UPI0009EDB048|nr:MULTISPECIES: WXG100 family type VII secretion target [unclassified Mycobacterium]
MSRRYTVDFEALAHFVERLAIFDSQAEQIATEVNSCVAELSGAWSGQGANAERQYHQKWLKADSQMREGLDALRKNVEIARRNYIRTVQHNTVMWP